MALKQIPNLPVAIALNGTEQLEAVQAGTSVRITTDQIADYIGTGATTLNIGITPISGGLDNTLLFQSSGGVLGEIGLGSTGQVLTGVSGGPPIWTAPSVGSLVVGTTIVSNGTAGRILYDNSGALGEYATTGTGNVMMGTNPTITGTILKNGVTVLPFYNVQADFGCTLDGTTDDLANFNLAIAAWNAAPGIFFIPAGTLKLSAKPNAFTASGGVIAGSGERSTVIAAAYTGDDIFRINGQFTAVHDMTFSPSVFRGSGYDIVLGYGCFRNPISNVSHIYGAQGIKVTDASGVMVSQTTMFNMIGDTGIFFGGTVGNGGSFGLNVLNSSLSNTRPVEWTSLKAFATSTAYSQGDVVSSGGYYWIVQTAGTTAGSPGSLTIDTSTPSSWATTNVTHGTAGFRVLCDDDMTWIRVDSYASSLTTQAVPLLGGVYGIAMTDTAATGTSYPNWIFSEDLECDHQVQSCIRANAGKGITIGNSWFGSTLAGNGVWLYGSYLGETTITGSKFLALGGVGVWLDAGVDTQITGNTFLACSTAAIGTLPGIYLAPNIGKTGIVGNVFGSHVGVGSGYMSRAVLIDTGTGDYITVTGNTSYDLASSPAILNGASGTHNLIRNNNPIQASTLMTVAEGGIGVGTLTGLAKGNGTSAFSAAAAGTDYVAPGAVTTSGLTMTTARLLGRSTGSTGAIEEITVGAGLSLSGGALTASGGANVTIGSSTITGGTTTRVLYDNAGVLGEYVISGTGSVAMTTSPTFTTPVLGAATGTSLSVTGALVAGSGTAITAGGSTTGVSISSTAGFGVFVGSGAPTLSRSQGSLYLRSDGVPYYNTNGTTGWNTVLVTGGALGTPSSGTATNLTGLSLTTGVTGTLPVANGGTGTATAFTWGSVVFAGTSGVYTQDNATFFWDNTLKYLGIGTAVPAQKLEISQSQSAGTWAQITNASDNIAATTGVRLVTGSGGDYVDIFTSGNLNYFQFSGGGGIVDGRMGFDAITMQNNAATQMTRLTTGGLRIGSTIANATSPLMVEGPVATPITTITADTTITTAHSTIISNRGATNTLTLPNPATCVGRKYHIVTIQAFTVVSASSNVVPRTGGAAGTAILAATDGAWAIIQSDGSNWILIAGTP